MSLLLVAAARENSTRLPQKMVRPLADTNLFELLMEKLNYLSKGKNPFDNMIIAVNENDKILMDIASRYDIEIVKRSDKSITQAFTTITETQDYLTNFDEDYIININGCFPFLRPATITHVANYFLQNRNIKSLCCAKERHQFFYQADSKKPINNLDPRCLSTILMPPVLEGVNSILIYNRKTMLDEARYWDYTEDNPYIYIVEDNEECLDVHNKLDFDICEGVYKNRYGNKESLLREMCK